MKGTGSVWALVPIKEFAAAKSRLAGSLDRAECGLLAEHMARDVLVALTNARGVETVTVLGTSPPADVLAKDFGCTLLAENPGNDLNEKLNAAAKKLRDSADTLLLLPGDLPTVTAQDIDRLLQEHDAELIVYPADRDGGTNALRVSPPDAVPFQFGANSAQAHLDAGRRAGLAVARRNHPVFARDIDTAEDLLWLCRHMHSGHTGKYLDESGIRQRLLNTRMAALG
jgi:2-phospho-L-lactate guanylyltransferase